MERKTRYSRQRELIFEFIKASCEHPSAETIYEQLKPHNPNLSLGTVYRNLSFLEKEHLINRIVCSKDSIHYEAVQKEHAHFVCTRCGSISDIHNLDLKKTEEMASLGQGFKVERIDITLQGICQKCREKEASQSTV